MMFPKISPVWATDGAAGAAPAGGEGSGGGSAAPAAGGGQGAPNGAAGGAPDPYSITAGVKPEALPDKFWNPDTKAIRLPELMKGYNEANSLIGRRAEEMKDADFQALVTTRVEGMEKQIRENAMKTMRGEAPKEAKDYALAIDPEVAKLLPSAMQEVSQYESDPLVTWFRGYAHELGLGPQQFNKAFSGYLKVVSEAQKASSASEISRLGENGNARIEKLGKFIEANLDARTAKSLLGSFTTADGFAALEALVTKLQSPQLIASGFEGLAGAGTTGPALASEDDIRAAMRDPRYFDPNKRDMAYVKRIEAAWKALYPQRVN